jgi:hypothetical protein
MLQQSRHFSFNTIQYPSMMEDIVPRVSGFLLCGFLLSFWQLNFCQDFIPAPPEVILTVALRFVSFGAAGGREERELGELIKSACQVVVE